MFMDLQASRIIFVVVVVQCLNTNHPFSTINNGPMILLDVLAIQMCPKQILCMRRRKNLWYFIANHHDEKKKHTHIHTPQTIYISMTVLLTHGGINSVCWWLQNMSVNLVAWDIYYWNWATPKIWNNPLSHRVNEKKGRYFWKLFFHR